MKPPPPPTAVLDLPARLEPISALLDAFNHRNRNQHRRSTWWAHFSLLRRAVRKLSSPPTRTTAESRQCGSKKGPRGGASAGAGSDGLARRVQWVADYVVPPSYVAFTQLTADNQYAPLGLVLLGTLARFNSIISPLLRPSSRPRSTAAADLPGGENTPSGPGPSPASGSPLDLGVAISRDEFPLTTTATTATTTTTTTTTTTITRPTKRIRSLDVDNHPTPAREKSAVASTRPDTLSATAAGDKDKVKKKKKTKKSKKTTSAGTDLSALFDSIA